MLDALYTAASGMIAQQTGLDVIANNLANANTVGFKGGRAVFADLLYTQLTPQSGAVQGSKMGLGVGVAAVQTEMGQGTFQQTNGVLDVAIAGDGYLQVKRADGTLGYTRAGNLTLDASGQLVTSSGDIVQPPIKVPPGADMETFAIDGTTGAVSVDVKGKKTTLGKMQVAVFANPNGLESIGGNLFAETVNSGPGALTQPTKNGAGTLVQGTLEMSNVSAVDEMVGMITTQRAYEAVAKVVTASDEMLNTANQLRR